MESQVCLKKAPHSNSGLKDLSDEEVSRRSKEKSLSKKERKRYVTEDKARKSRNKQKRNSHY